MRCYTPAMSSRALIAMFLNFASQLRFRNLFLVVIGLFFFNLLIPDFIPLIDEIMLGLLAIVLGSWKSERKKQKEENQIENEIMDNDKK
jgi:cadmium resistance protein CadD (predicted permease)